MSIRLKRYRDYILIGGIVALAALVRTYRINEPLADWHSWRQADTAAVARNFVQDDFNIFYPQSDSLWSLSKDQLPNPNRWFLNEFPLYNAAIALIYRQYDVNHVYGRVVSILASSVGIAFLYLITKKLFDAKTALVASLYYALLPYNVYYGRVVMPDPTFVSLSIVAMYVLIRWVESKKISHATIFSLMFALAMLVKPYAVFMIIPFAYWIYRNWGWKEMVKPRSYIPLALAFLPLLLWRWHSAQHPEGSFASSWLLNEGGIRFKGAFFRWIIYDRLNRLIFATGGFVLLVIGALKSYETKKGSLITAWLIGILTYITVFAKGNVNHDYYQLPIVPVGSILVAIGFFAIINMGRSKLGKIVNATVATSLVLMSLAFGWYEVRGFFNINNPAIVEAGKKIDEIIPPDALVIAPYQGDPAFLYQTNRHGWPVGGDIDNKINEGADYYVTTSRDDEYGELKARYGILYETDTYSIIKLGSPQ